MYLNHTVIDAHQHFWNLDEVDYPWLNEAYGAINRTFTPQELAPELIAAGVDGTVLVQAANSFADTAAMITVASKYPFVRGVVGWIPLTDPGAAEHALDEVISPNAICGIRHLNHEEGDPNWLVQSSVKTSLGLLAERDLVYEAVATTPRDLEHVCVLAACRPDLKIVVDHLGKPPIREGGWDPWATQLTKAASYENVYSKVSGLNTAAHATAWSADDLRPYVQLALDSFGPRRLMFGSDWPVANLAGDYQKVWGETLNVLDGLEADDLGAVLGGTAIALYGLDKRRGDVGE